MRNSAISWTQQLLFGIQLMEVLINLFKFSMSLIYLESD